MKTTNQATTGNPNGGYTQLGVPAYSIQDPYWKWTSTAWNGPNVNGSSQTIPNWVQNDFWAMWPFAYGDYHYAVQQWFKTTLDLPACTAALLSQVRLINKYNPPTGQPILGINDDLFVWVNGGAAAAGGDGLGTTPYKSLGAPWTPPPHGNYTPAVSESYSVETAGWVIPGGLALPTALFNAGANQINVLTDDVAAWGGMPHVVFQVTQAGPCVGINANTQPGCLSFNGRGVIPVVIFGSSTFDVTKVNLSSLSLNGLTTGVAPQCSLQNVNGEAYLDLVCQFADPLLWIGGTGGTRTVLLTGRLRDGTPFAGSDQICVAP